MTTKIPRPLSVKHNSIWNLLGSLTYALTQWGILMIIAKISTPEKVGIFTLALALTAPLVLFFRFNLGQVVVTDYNNDYSFNDYYSYRLITNIFFIFTSVLISLLYLPNVEIVLIIILLSCSKYIESISDILHARMQKKYRMDYSAKSKIQKGIFSLIVFSIIMITSNSLILSTSGYLLSWLAVLILYDYPKANTFGNVKFHFNKYIIVKILVLSLPLGFAQLIASLNANTPRFLLEYFYDTATLGFFGAMMYIITAGNNFVMAVNAAILPKLSEFYVNKNTKSYISLLIGFISIILLSSILILIFINYKGASILTIIYTEEYASYSDEFLLFMVLGLVIYVNKALEGGLTATKTFKIQPFLNGISLMVIIIGSIYLIPNYGIVGAVYSLAIGELIQMILRSYYIYKSLRSV